MAELSQWARRCAVCGWLLSDAKAHVDATYEDHTSDRPARAWRDRHGDVWTYDDGDGLMHSFETAPFPREHVEKKWGPLVPEPDNREEGR